MSVILLKVTKGSQVCQVQAALPVQAMKTYRGGRSIAPLILHLRTRSRQVVGFMTKMLFLKGNNSQYPLKRGLDGQLQWSESLEKRQVSTRSFYHAKLYMVSRCIAV
jgi:hypothetical protein